MSHNVTDVPLKLNTTDEYERNCKLYESTYGMEWMRCMIYTVKKQTQIMKFAFDPEDFDVIDGVSWCIDRYNCYVNDKFGHMPVSDAILDKYHTRTNKYIKFKNPNNRDFRKIYIK
ncbi:MAG: hypothetical protein Faunusvirus2_58 [Faunusvirus sp.]|jgi:hypothetical protein|uniref:Uncharacterized protein n=1 Tax=Faunusvirus sp. TaxID=2487766 RepID=A0A3G4ZYN3_9VIRU|nr:MAG: hypothetical protein Faunusvirus2_58 [Faunusvirus sp.]